MASAGDDEFTALFGRSPEVDFIRQVRNNDPDCTTLYMASEDGEADRDLTDAAWERLGSYIAGNDYLWRLDLSECQLDDSNVAAIFKGLTASNTLTDLSLYQNRVDLDFIRCMIPFLQRSPNLSRLSFEGNADIDDECFAILLESINRTRIETLNFRGCSLTSLVALGEHAVPNLQGLYLTRNGITDIHALTNYTCLKTLDLAGNSNIGADGFRAIADLLRKESCSLEHLNVESTGMGDSEAKLIADALTHNSKLDRLNITQNQFGREGLKEFLKLLNDVSSIKRTEASNHSLRHLSFSWYDSWLRKYIEKALKTNRKHYGNPFAAGRAKIINTQLCQTTRKDLSHLQGIECPSFHNLFFNLDPVLVPNVFALVGARNNEQNDLYRGIVRGASNRQHSDLYQAIVAKAPDLISLIDRKAMLHGELAKNVSRIGVISAQFSALIAELNTLNAANSRLGKQLTSIEPEVEMSSLLSGRKRGREEY